MGPIHVSAEGKVDAPAGTVYGYLADMREHHPRFLPSSRVRVSSSWDGAAGVGGFFERRFAPRVMQGIYAGTLERLNAYVREHAALDPGQPGT